MGRLKILLTSVMIVISCKSPDSNDFEVNKFNIEMKHFYGAEGYSLKYVLNQDSLKLRYDCDFENCKDTLLYKVKLEGERAKAIYSFLRKSEFDTLKKSYINDGLDGRYTFVKISGDSIFNKKIRLERFSHSLIEELIEKVDASIPETKYRLYSHKYK